jgi:transposase
MVAANTECALRFQLSPGNAGDAPQGRKLLLSLGSAVEPCSLLADRAYEGDETRLLIRDLGFSPVIPQNPNRLKPWETVLARTKKGLRVFSQALGISGRDERI